MRRAVCVGLAMLAGVARAAPYPTDLYAASAYVTGTRAETRGDAVVTAFRRVLVKVSGNPGLAEDSRVAALDALAASMVEDVAYLDRMSDEPHHDEQGTRDRPFDLLVHFDPRRINGALAALGEAPWAVARPRIVARIAIVDHGATFPLTADGESAERHLEALLAAADRFGMRVAVPLSDAPDLAVVQGDVTLTGTMTWSDKDFGWVGRWRLAAPRGAVAWEVSGVSFDEAYRDAMAGALSALSGHRR